MYYDSHRLSEIWSIYGCSLGHTYASGTSSNDPRIDIY